MRMLVPDPGPISSPKFSWTKLSFPKHNFIVNIVHILFIFQQTVFRRINFRTINCVIVISHDLIILPCSLIIRI